MRIALMNAKGGVAKTTSSMYLAAAASLRGERAVVLDADPQSSASLWADMASNDSGGVGFDVVPANISSLRRPCEEGAWEFVDAPPSGRILETAIASADFVVVPTSDSPMDLQQAWSTLDAIHGSRPAAVLIVRAERGTRAYVETVQALDSAGTPRFESVVFKRQEIKKSIGERPEKLFEYAEVFAELRRELHEG